MSTAPKRLALSALATALAANAPAQSLKTNEVLSSIGVSVIATPRPVLGADNRVHLAYELLASNPTALFITLDKVEAMDGQRSLGGLAGAKLKAMATLHGGSGTTIAPGGSAVVFMDTSFTNGAKLPPTISAKFTITRQLAGAGGKPVAFPKTEPLPATVSFTGPPIGIETAPAVLIDPPLRGARWVAVNGCCDELTSHRGAVMAVNGVLHAPERFAIDWLQLQPDNRLFTGAVDRLASYAYFGVPVYAVADGTVVNTYNQAVEQVPGKSATGITTENIGGNMIVLDIGGGNFAFFAHLQPGSLKVKLGDHVRRGQVIALLGNTGNSTAPHLHFHIMNGTSPLDASGLPFVLTHFTVRGVLDEATIGAMFDEGKPAIVLKGQDLGAHVGQLPLNNEVTDF